MGSIRQIIATAAVTAAMLTAMASTAFAAGTLTVGINGAGAVSGVGIECTRAAGDATTSGDCAQRYLDCATKICIDPQPPLISIEAGDPGRGFVFAGWSGACAKQLGTSCNLKMDDDYAAIANFADNTDPTVTLGAVASVLRGSVTLSATAGDNAAVARVDFSVGGKTFTAKSSPYSVTVDTGTLADGQSAVAATAVDSSGRSATDSRVVTIDNTAPALTVTGPNGATFGPNSTQSWTIAASDKLSGPPAVQCSLVPEAAQPAFGPCSGGNVAESVSGKPGGAYVLTVRARDGAGNVRDVTRTFTIDATPPVTTVLSGLPDGGVTSGTSVTWDLAASEPGVVFACRVYPAALTPGAFAPCSAASSHTASGFAPGVYAFEVRATDAVGNVEVTPVRRTFTVIAPPAALAAPPVAAAAVTSPQLQSAKHAPEPSIVVTLAFSFADSTRTHTKLTSLVVKGVPRGATVTASCRKQCSAKTFKKTHAFGKVSLARLIRKPLKVGSTIRVTVSRPGSTSAIKTLKIRPHKAPSVTTRCQPEGASKPTAC
jgi:hypothetical protein